MKYEARVADVTYKIEIEADDVITFDGEPVDANLLQVGPLGLYSLIVDHRSLELVVEETQHGYRIMLGSNTFDVRVVDERQLLLAGRRIDLLVPSGEVTVKAPIPGVIVRVLVSEGEKVELNQPVLILEAMKMENELRAPRAGSVKAIKVQAGEQVEQGTSLLILH